MKLLTSILAVLACLALASVAAANDHYVSPTGSSAGAGTLASPWDLQTALSQPSTVLPGDTIWVLGGTYRAPSSSGFESFLSGTASSPIVVRNYQGQRATIDGYGTEYTLAVYGSYAWFWGLELMDSNTMRTSATTTNPNAWGMSVYAAGVKCINMIVHDTAEGFSAYSQSPDSEYYGNLSYYNGFVGPDRNHGHGFYMQNATGTKVISDNIVGDNADEGMQIYGSASADIIGFNIVGNLLYNTGSWPSSNYQSNIILAGGAVRQDIQIENNYSFFPPASFGGYMNLGEAGVGQDVAIQNNVFVGGYQSVDVEENTGPVSYTGNINYTGASALRLAELLLYNNEGLSSYTWDNNTYYDLTPYHFFFGSTTGSSTSGSNDSFATWKSQTGFDADSSYTQSAPTGVWTYVRPNKYESKRANIAIYNWSSSSSVGVDLSTVLSSGDQYVVLDAQNFFGSPVASGTYSGGTVSIPMTGLSKATPVGFAAPAHTAPLYGTFVVMVPGAGAAMQPQPPSSPAPTAVVVTTISLPGGTAGTSYSTQLTASGGTSPYTFTASGLPANLTASSSGLISGTPASASTSTVSVTATDSRGASGSTSLSLAIAAAAQTPPAAPSSGPLSVTPQMLPNGAAGQAYSTQLVATGGTAPYRWVFVGGVIPPGLNLSTTGLLSGTPQSATGQVTFYVYVYDSAGGVVTNVPFNINVTSGTSTPNNPAPTPVVVTTTSLPGGTAGASYSTQLSASGGTAPYTFVVSGLPANLSFSSQGSISGTPMAAGKSIVSVTATDSRGASGSASLSLTIAAAPVAPAPPPPGASGGALTVAPQAIPNGVVGQPYSAQLVATGGTAPYRWLFVGGVIPPGLNLSSSGLLSGTPQMATGQVVFYVYVYDSAGSVLTNVPFPMIVTN